MIAIKQAKFKPSNKIQENQIKNITTTTKPSNVAQTNDDSHHQHLQNHHQHNQNQVISSKNDNYSCQAQQQDGLPPAAAAAAALKSTVSDNNHQRPHHHHHHQNNNNHHHHQQQQQSNETRSETIDGVTTTTSAVPTKSSTNAPPSSRAASTLATLPSSTATTSSLSTAAATASPASASPMAVKQARQQLQQQQPQAHQPAASLTTASAKIQQRQQKFLAAAARSATSPQCHLDQNLSVIKQQQQAKTRIGCVATSESCSQIDGPTPAAAASVVTPDDCTWCKTTGPAPIECEQCTMQQQHAEDASSAGNSGAMALKTACKKSCSLASAEHRPQSQQMPAFNKRQTVPLLATPPSKSETIEHQHHGVTMARSKVLSMATAMMSGNGQNPKNSAGSSSKQRASIDNDQYRSNSAKSCASLGATEAIATAAASPESCGTATAAAAAAANIGVLCDVDDSVCNQKCARPASPLRCDANTNLSTTKTTTTGTYQQQVSPPATIISQKRAEVRQQSSGEQQNNDDNISNKNTTTSTKHNNHYHYHHYYNQNYLNFHRFQQQQHHQHQQQQQQPHQNYFHQQNQHTTINSSTNQTTTQSQHQPVMAHYKFHNDCQSSVLTYEQVKRLDFVMDQTVPIHGRGNSPTLYVKLKELIRLVKYKLQHEHSIEIRDVRLNGGAASYVLAPENSKYNDLDLVFGTDLSNEDRFDVIRDVVLDCLMEFYPQANQTQDQSTGGEGGCSLSVNGSNIELTGGNNENEEEEDEEDQQASRSNRSSSFESDNLNVTTNELGDDASDGSEEEDDDDDEDDVIVRIDSDDTGCGDLDGKNEEGEEEDGGSELVVGDTGRDLTGHHCNAAAQVAGKLEEEDAMEPPTIAEHQHHASSYPSYSSYHQYHQMPPNNINMNINNCAFKEAYVHKMVKVNDDDRWSLISLGVQQSETTQGGYGAGGYLQQAHGCNQQVADFATVASPAPNADWCDNSHANQQQEQQNQLPNSIELKFVDKMRRKFEFSVDSFQIILDSLVQFYDFAPQSTITIQRKTSSGNPIFNANPLMGLRHCLQCDREQSGVKASGTSETSVQEPIKSAISASKCKTTASQSAGKKYSSRAHCETTSLSGARSFYELPLEPGNSLSNSSVASSSGCSSSSSVVSSSSSSLSCDEDQDQEDLYCYVDNSPSSSASTSSLLSSSTTTSGAGSPCDPLLVGVDSRSTSKQQQRHQNKNNVISNSSGQELTNQHNNNCNYQARRHQQQAAAVAYQVPNCISSTGKQHHVNTGQFTSENLCNNFAAKTTISDHKISSCAVISENFYPTVIGRSEYGNFKEALYHLEKKLIATRSPEEIRGGGLLKYCNLLVKNYKPTNVYQIRTLERYMCSRFFIDFSDLNQQRAKLESYLANHFSDDAKQKFDYLTILHNVVQRSTVCLMNHELRLTLNMIREFAYNLPQQQQQNQNQTTSSNVGQVQQLPCAGQQQADQQRSPAEKPGHFYQQQKPTSMQSGVYRVKLVNYALAKPVRT